MSIYRKVHSTKLSIGVCPGCRTEAFLTLKGIQAFEKYKCVCGRSGRWIKVGGENYVDVNTWQWEAFSGTRGQPEIAEDSGLSLRPEEIQKIREIVHIWANNNDDLFDVVGWDRTAKILKRDYPKFWKAWKKYRKSFGKLYKQLGVLSEDV